MCAAARLPPDNNTEEYFRKRLDFFAASLNVRQTGAYMPSGQKRMTRQRLVILEELRGTRTHPTADELHHMVRARLPRVSLGTVYRNLDILAEEGAVLKLEPAGGGRRFDGSVLPHHHVRCVRCGRVADIMCPVSIPETDGLCPPGFRITAARVEFDGVCDFCAAAETRTAETQTEEVCDV
jgi:Fur family ferric uptake transcriptional regulator